MSAVKFPLGVLLNGASASSSGLAKGFARDCDFRVEFRDGPVGLLGVGVVCLSWLVSVLSRAIGRKPSATTSKSSTSNESSKTSISPCESPLRSSSLSSSDRRSAMGALGQPARPAQPSFPSKSSNSPVFVPGVSIESSWAAMVESEWLCEMNGDVSRQRAWVMAWSGVRCWQAWCGGDGHQRDEILVEILYVRRPAPQPSQSRGASRNPGRSPLQFSTATSQTSFITTPHTGE